MSLPVAFSSSAAGPAVVIDDRIRLRFAEQDRLAIRTHFADHGAAVEEMSSFIGIAANANILFDVGADRGIFSLVFCGSGDRKRAVAYEPSPSRFAAATALAALNACDGRLMLRQAALEIRTAGRAGPPSPMGPWSLALTIRPAPPPTSR